MFYLCFLVTFLSIQIVHGVTQINGSTQGVYYQYNEDDESAVLGEGSFGKAIIGWKFKDGLKLKVAMKFEKIRPGKKAMVDREAIFYKKLAGHVSIPKYHDCVKDGKGNAVLIIELLGPSLRKCQKQFGKFTIARTMHIGLQILDVIEHLHEKRVAHNDLKPHNFAVGYDNSSRIYIFDFGIATDYKTQGSHVEKEKKNVGNGRGTGDYMSEYAHSHQVLSRRDDAESIAYMLIEFLNGKLPWNGCSMKDMALMKKGWILDENGEEIKFTYEERCGNICQTTLIDFLKYSRRIQFHEKPDYFHLKGLLKRQLRKHRPLDMVQDFDWFLAASKNRFKG